MDYCAVVAGVLALVLYINTLGAEFTYDDRRAIVKNQDLLPKTSIWDLFFNDFWGTPLTHSGSHKSYRPLCVLTFRLNYYLGELNPWGYHLGNALLHAIVTALYTVLARKILRYTFPTLVAGLLFASHPVHTEAVASIVGRADVGACLFFILSFQCYIKYVEKRDFIGESSKSSRYFYFLGTAVFTAASMLTKEQGVTVLGVCAVYELFVYHKIKFYEIFKIYKLPKLRKSMEGLVLLVSIGVCLITFRMYSMDNKPPKFSLSDNPASESESISTRILTFLLLPSYNFWLFLCPRVLSFDWSMESVPLVESSFDFRNIYSLLFYSGLLFLGYHVVCSIHKPSPPITHMNGNGFANQTPTSNGKTIHTIFVKNIQNGLNNSSKTDAHKKPRMVTLDVIILSLAMMIFPFILATNLFFYVGFVIAERVLYIPSMGYCLLVGQGAFILQRHFSVEDVRRKAVSVMFLVLIGFFSVKTVIRNKDWQTEERLYTSGIAINPAKGWSNLANIYSRDGRVEDAEMAYRNALKNRGNMADAHYNLGILLQQQKRTEEAIDAYRMAIQCRPKLSVAYLNLALIFAEVGRHEEAEKIYRHCADLDTSELKDPRLHENTKISCLYNMGHLLTNRDRTQEALTIYEEALRRLPDYYPPHSIHNMMGEVYVKMGLYDEAEKCYQEAINSKTDHIPAYLTMALLFHKKNQNNIAEEWFLKARDIDPSDTLFYNHYGQFLLEIGRVLEAVEYYKIAVQKSPTNHEIIMNAANALRQAEDNAGAEDFYRQGVLLKPDSVTGLMNFGAMLHFNGKLEEAEEIYLKALKLRPDDDITTANLAKLKMSMKYSQQA